MANRWSKEAERELLGGIGAYGYKWFQRKAGKPYDGEGAPKHRSKYAIRAKIQRMFGRGGITRGVHNVASLCRETGYHPKQVYRARDALKQKWKRTSFRGRHILSDEQVDEIIAWLTHDYWCSRHRLYNCAWCTSDAEPHRALGLCIRCYPQYLRYCQRIGVPSNLNRQLTLTRGELSSLENTAHASMLNEVQSQLSRGVALGEDCLDWLATVLE